MIKLSKKSVVLMKGIFYITLGIILGLNATDLKRFALMKYLLFGAAIYFLACGVYYSGLYDQIRAKLNLK